MFGAIVVALPDLVASAGAMTGRALTGDLLALAGAATAACYVIAGRRLRSVLDIWPYVTIVYGVCFVMLLIFARVVNAPVLGQPPREMAIFRRARVGPMLFGHTGLNWALKYLPAYVVNLTLLGEPVGATFLAALLPGIREIPRMPTVVGGLLVLVGIFVAARSTRQSASPSECRRRWRRLAARVARLCYGQRREDGPRVVVLPSPARTVHDHENARAGCSGYTRFGDRIAPFRARGGHRRERFVSRPAPATRASSAPGARAPSPSR